MSLKNLIALQKGKASAPVDAPNGESDATSPPTDEAVDAAGTESVSPSEASPPDSQAGDTVADAPESPAPTVRTGLGLNLLKAGRAVGAAVPKPATRSVETGQGSGDSTNASDSGNDDSVGFSLEDLAGFDASEASAPIREPKLGSGFDDEIEATAPDRAFDTDLTQQQLQFVESLDGIYPVLHDPDLFGQAIRIIMLELQENPEYKKLLADQDVHTMIRGMRSTMGMAQVRKQEKSRKTGAAGKKSAKGKSQVSDEDMALLDKLLG